MAFAKLGSLGKGFGKEGSTSLAGAGQPTPPAGFVYLIDQDGAYLTDQDGSYLMEPA
jgi:hypothetical protein